MKIGKESEVKVMLTEAQNFVSSFDELISDISDKDIADYRAKIFLFRA